MLPLPSPGEGGLLRAQLRRAHPRDGSRAAGVPHPLRQVRRHPDRPHRRHRAAGRPPGRLGGRAGRRRRRDAARRRPRDRAARHRRLHRRQRRLGARLAEPHAAVVPGQGVGRHDPASARSWSRPTRSTRSPASTSSAASTASRCSATPRATLVFDAADLLAYVSTFTVLRPGDLVLTGTPGGVGVARDPQRLPRRRRRRGDRDRRHRHCCATPSDSPTRSPP